MTPEQKRAQRMRHGAVAAGLMVLILIVGTFAWYNYTQSAINPMYDETNHGGRIHDNFEGDLEERSASGARNKDVYAENFGETPLFVRIRLLEYLAFDEEPLLEGWDIDDPMTWTPYRSQNSNVHARRGETPTFDQIGQSGIRWELGHDINSDSPHRGPKYFMPTFNRASHMVPEDRINLTQAGVAELFNHSNAFRMTDASGFGVEWYSNPGGTWEVPLHERIEHASDFRIHGTQSAPGLDEANMRSAAGDEYGLHNRWNADSTFTSFRIHTPIYGPRGFETPNRRELVVESGYGANAEGMYTHRAQPTLTPSVILPEDEALAAAFRDQFLQEVGESVEDFRGIMTIVNWYALGRPAGNFWIHDTYDAEGWFYWNGFLRPGTDPYGGVTNATSLLLDEIYIPAFSRSWEYIILVDGDFFRPETIAPLNLTEQAMYIFNLAQGITPEQ